MQVMVRLACTQQCASKALPVKVTILEILGTPEAEQRTMLSYLSRSMGFLAACGGGSSRMKVLQMKPGQHQSLTLQATWQDFLVDDNFSRPFKLFVPLWSFVLVLCIPLQYLPIKYAW